MGLQIGNISSLQIYLSGLRKTKLITGFLGPSLYPPTFQPCFFWDFSVSPVIGTVKPTLRCKAPTVRSIPRWPPRCLGESGNVWVSGIFRDSPYYSHTTPIRVLKDIWKWYGKLTIMGSHCGESLESPLIEWGNQTLAHSANGKPVIF